MLTGDCSERLSEWLERGRDSHHTFRRPGVSEQIHLQRDGSKAKVYQVRQVRTICTKYALGGGAATTAEEG